MANALHHVAATLRARPRRWLVTGAAGFIGSNLCEALLRLDQTVVGLDNFSTGSRRNLDDVRRSVGEAAARRMHFVEGDIRDPEACARACRDTDFVLHQAALGSVPRSLADPATTNAVNVGGFVQMLLAARDAGVQRFVYAASSSTYGDHPDLPKVEDRIGRPLSPYAVSKLADELYARVFASAYGISTVGLRYFNVFGPRQDPNGAYAAVIPRWIGSLLTGERCTLFGDGETSRDFTYVDNVVQINLLAALADSDEVSGQVYNAAVGQRTSLNQLFRLIRDALAAHDPALAGVEPVREPTRAGDVRHSQADISLARRVLGYEPTHDLRQGLEAAVPWYLRHHAAAAVGAGA